MDIAEKLDQVECRRDSQARRILNVCNETADITADELEGGVSLERLEALNVPCFRYSTQVTIHGRLPDFSPNARPGGYKALFLNSNGSAGVRYAAIDASKKSLIARACAAAKGDWHANLNSSGLEVSRLFIVRDEAAREAVKASARTALKLIPSDLFFGNAFACCLAYGAGYGVGANIGAVYEKDLWALISFFSGFANLAELESGEKALKAEREAQYAEMRASHERESAIRSAALKVKMDALRPQLTPIAEAPEEGAVYVESNMGFLTVLMEKARGRLFYTILERNFEKAHADRKLAKTGFPWPKALAAGHVYAKAA